MLSIERPSSSSSSSRPLSSSPSAAAAAAAAARTTRSPAILAFVNHHGSPFHYTGHEKVCGRRRGSVGVGENNYRLETLSRRMDQFRVGLAEALTAVAPQNCKFLYAVTTSCSHVHGIRPTLPCPFEAGTFHKSVRDCLADAKRRLRRDEVWFPPQKIDYTEVQLVRGIRDGSLTGFVTIEGGQEPDPTELSQLPGHRFGFCVQNYAPRRSDLSPRTQREIASHYGFPCPKTKSGIEKLDAYLAKQPPRTLNAATFFSEETISTTYLAWLIEARGFHNFRITHFLHYEFRNWSADYLLPVLQRRHEEKKAGRLGAAECLKLLGNGSYGYNGLESSNYDDLRLITSENLDRALRKSLAHLSVKHVTQIGLVRIQERKKKKTCSRRRRRRRRRNARGRVSDFFADEVEVTDDDDDDDDESEAEAFEEEVDEAPATAAPTLADEVSSAGYRVASANLESAISSALDRKERHPYRHSDHSYAKTEQTPITKGAEKYTFLWAVVTDGSRKRIFNTLPRAVAVLSNSKRLFLGHVSLMLECLDPRLAELCYIDTDSCVWSQTHSDIDSCILPAKKAKWQAAEIIADESGLVSCHGKLKLEGLFDGGLFKTLKIYRLFNRSSSSSAVEDEAETWRVAYTRCKGIARWAADKLPSDQFDPLAPVPREASRLAVHRNCLRPSRAGEIRLYHETRSPALPFNLKRWVTADGLHTLALGLPRHLYSNDHDDDVDEPDEARLC